MITSRFFQRALMVTGLLLASASANAVQSVDLPAWVCTHPDAIFVGGFESGEMSIAHNPSSGNGGSYPGNVTRNVHVAGLGSGTQSYYLYIPNHYSANRSWPVLLALDGVAPYATAGTYAQAVINTWAPIADAAGFIVAAPVGNAVFNDNNNQPYAISWLVPPSSGANDYDMFASIRSDIQGAYNIDRNRIYGWGFSAGGHVMHDLGINQYSAAFNASTMAAYAVVGGDLAGLACQGLSDSQCNLALTSLSRKIPVDIHIGNSDPNYSYAASDATRFKNEGWIDGQTLFFTAFVGGHTYTSTGMQQAWDHLCPNAIIP
ncbi:MAG: hypothetical protein ABI304_06755 [Rudaea sp.]